MSQADPEGSVRPRGPWQVAKRLYGEASEHYVSVLAAAVSYNFFFALFPGLTAAVSMYGLVADAEQVEQHLNLLTGVLPAEVLDLLRDQLQTLTGASGATLSLSFLASLGIALFSSTRGVRTLMDGLNIIHESRDRRGFVKRLLLALALTLGAMLFVLVTIAVIAIVPVLLGFLGLGGFASALISAARWPALAGLVLFSLAVVYRFGPCREAPRWRWISWGAALATLVWLIASGGFSFYVARFGSYNQTYGSVGAVMVVLIWMYLTGYIVLLGAQLDAILEQRTVRANQAGTDQKAGEEPAVRNTQPSRAAGGRR